MTYWQPRPRRERSRLIRAVWVVAAALVCSVAGYVAILVFQGPTVVHRAFGTGRSCSPGPATTLVGRGDGTSWAVQECLTGYQFGGTWETGLAGTGGFVLGVAVAGFALRPWQRRDPGGPGLASAAG